MQVASGRSSQTKEVRGKADEHAMKVSATTGKVHGYFQFDVLNTGCYQHLATVRTYLTLGLVAVAKWLLFVRLSAFAFTSLA